MSNFLNLSPESKKVATSPGGMSPAQPNSKGGPTFTSIISTDY